uniref:Pecanex-like protein n=1 Tax=Mesocestoides corti TaxID=53468 RepID=A0A5K3F7L6_MESCO
MRPSNAFTMHLVNASVRHVVRIPLGQMTKASEIRLHESWPDGSATFTPMLDPAWHCWLVRSRATGAVGSSSVLDAHPNSHLQNYAYLRVSNQENQNPIFVILCRRLDFRTIHSYLED